MGAGPRAQPGRLRAGVGRFRRRQQLSAFDFERKRRRGRVVPARAARGLPAVVSGQPRLFRQRQPQQHDRHQHDHHQRVQQSECDQRLCEPAGTRRRRSRAGDGIRAVAARVEGGGAAVERNGRQRADFSRRCRGARSAKRSRRRTPGGQPARWLARSRERAARGCSQRAACSAGRLRRAGARVGREAGDAACACRERGAQAGRTGASAECRRCRTAEIGAAERAAACECSRRQTQRARQTRRAQGRHETGGSAGCTAAGYASAAGCPRSGETCTLAGASRTCASCTSASCAGFTGGPAAAGRESSERGASTRSGAGRKGRSGRQG